ALRDHPLTGVGPGNFEIAFPAYRPVRNFALTGIAVPETSAHSWLASLGAEAGVLGLVAFAALLITLAIVSWRRRAHDLVILGWAIVLSYLAVGLVSVDDVGTQWLFWCGVASIGLGSTSVARDDVVSRAGRYVSWRDLLPLVAPAIWFAASLPALAASHAVASSDASARNGRVDVAIAAARNAVMTDPRRAIYWHYLGIAYTKQAKFREAGDAFAKATELAPHNAVYRANFSRAEVGLGTTSDKTALPVALDAARRAVAIDPNNPDPQFALALAAAANSRYEDAVAASERGRVLDTA